VLLIVYCLCRHRPAKQDVRDTYRIRHGGRQERASQAVSIPTQCPVSTQQYCADPRVTLQVPGKYCRSHAHASAHPNVHPGARRPHLLACTGANRTQSVHAKPLTTIARIFLLYLRFSVCVWQWLVENHPTKPSKAEWHEVRVLTYRAHHLHNRQQT